MSMVLLAIGALFSVNRTKVELKSDILRSDIIGIYAVNRTKVELKLSKTLLPRMKNGC